MINLQCRGLPPLSRTHHQGGPSAAPADNSHPTVKATARSISMNCITKALPTAAILLLLLHVPVANAQTRNPQQPPPDSPPQMVDMEEMHHHHTNIPLVKPLLPRLGRSQEDPTIKRLTLEDLEKMALEKNPTLSQAKSEITSAKARQLQSGLLPNPTVGYAGDEIRGGSFNGGEQGAFISQQIVTAGKLSLNKKIFGQDVRIAELESHEQELRVMNAVRIAYYRVLAAQEMLDSKKDLVDISAAAVKTHTQLQNVGQSDESETLEVEVENQKLQMDVMLQQNMLRQEWRALAAVVGNPHLEMQTLAGYLDKNLPDLDEDQVIATLLNDSPAVAIAKARADRATDVLHRARKEAIPDLELRAGLAQDREYLDPVTHRPAGLIGFAEAGVQLPIFDRNMYRNSKIMVDQYASQLLPRAQKAYELLTGKYGTMTASYPQVLKSQRLLYELHDTYISALEELWVNAVTLQGLLLTDGLEPPSRPSEIDIPVREINTPIHTSEMPSNRQP
jgi:cobalt-zinc-cadmium efflux system outer membrane protein